MSDYSDDEGEGPYFDMRGALDQVRRGKGTKKSKAWSLIGSVGSGMLGAGSAILAAIVPDSVVSHVSRGLGFRDPEIRWIGSDIGDQPIGFSVPFALSQRELVRTRRIEAGEPHYNSRRLVLEVTKDTETCIQWCKEQGLLPAALLCGYCGQPCRFYAGRKSVIGEFRCQRKHNMWRGSFRQSAAKGTWFENHKMKPDKIITLVYNYAHDEAYDRAILESSIDDAVTSRETIGDFYQYMEEVVENETLRIQSLSKLGGPGKIVQVDESKIGKRKYNVGRIIEGHWVLGIIESDSPRFRLEILGRGDERNIRDMASLTPVIQKHVEVGTDVYTDCWGGYNGLARVGFGHFTVNHSTNFVDPFTGVHTQKVESNWRPLKKRLLQDSILPKRLGARLLVYLWRRSVRYEKKDPFMTLINLIKRDFPGSTRM